MEKKVYRRFLSAWPLKCGLIRVLQVKWFLDYFTVNKLLRNLPFIYLSGSLTEHYWLHFQRKAVIKSSIKSATALNWSSLAPQTFAKSFNRYQLNYEEGNRNSVFSLDPRSSCSVSSLVPELHRREPALQKKSTAGLTFVIFYLSTEFTDSIVYTFIYLFRLGCMRLKQYCTTLLRRAEYHW